MPHAAATVVAILAATIRATVSDLTSDTLAYVTFAAGTYDVQLCAWSVNSSTSSPLYTFPSGLESAYFTASAAVSPAGVWASSLQLVSNETQGVLVEYDLASRSFLRQVGHDLFTQVCAASYRKAFSNRSTRFTAGAYFQTPRLPATIIASLTTTWTGHHPATVTAGGPGRSASAGSLQPGLSLSPHRRPVRLASRASVRSTVSLL